MTDQVVIRLHPDDIELLAKKIVTGMSESKAIPEKLIGVDELVELIAKPKGTIYQWSYLSERNGFPCSKRGKELRFKASDVQEWIRQRPKGRR